MSVGRALTAWLVGLGLLALVGCEAARPPAPGPTTDVSVAQREALADGVVSQAEYDAGFRRYVACMEAEGFDVIDLGVRRNLIDYAIVEDAEEADAYCYPFEYRDIDRTWQIAHLDDSDAADHLRACLVDHGVEPGETMSRMQDQLAEAGLEPGDC